MKDQPGHAGPLSGLRVIDLTQFLAGPYGTMILGDLGADVIKVETPSGELARHLPPHFVGPDSVYYLSINRNKRSLSVDLKTKEGLDVVKRLIATADIVIENFRPGVMKRIGLDHVTLRAGQPELIWCSISGFGQTGPSRDWPAYDMIVQALSGGMSLTGETDRAPVRAGIPLGDLSAGMYAAIGILAAVVERQKTGEGRVIDISMLDCQISMLTYQAAYWLHSGTVPGPQGRGHDSIPTYRAFTARDGRDVVVTANTENMWERLCTALGAEALTHDPRFRTNAERHARRTVLEPILEGLFLNDDAASWVERLREAGVPVAEVKTVDRALLDPQIAHRQMVIELTASDGRRVRTAGNPLRFDSTPSANHRYPPGLGVDSREILSEIPDLDGAQIAALLEKGVVTRPGG